MQTPETASQELTGKEQTATICLDKLTNNFELSARRWEIVVYPSLLAFIVLACYGFYLIYNLTRDIHNMSQSVDRYMGEMSSNMAVMSNTVSSMEKNLSFMTIRVGNMNQSLATLDPLLFSMESMSKNTQTINATMQHMQRHMTAITNDVTRPLHFINTYAPW